jgi:hypothetical protein
MKQCLVPGTENILLVSIFRILFSVRQFIDVTYRDTKQTCLTDRQGGLEP